MIEVEGISKKFGDFVALDNVSFKVNDGEVVGFVGLNGAGKTTTIRIIAGVLFPNKGDVLIDGHSVIREKKEASKNIGWVPELPIFELEFKAIDYFVYIAGFYGYSTSEAKRLAKELFDEVGLSGFENKRLRTYSQGMKKRFSLAVSLLSSPKNFLFDEVLNGLDVEGIAFFRNLVLKFKSEGKAVLFSSHILKEVEGLADKVVFIHKGKIVDIKSMNEIRNSATPETIVVLDRYDKEKVEKVMDFLNLTNYEVSGNTVIIKQVVQDRNKLIQSFITSGFTILEVKESFTDLEDYFFKVIGEKK